MKYKPRKRQPLSKVVKSIERVGWDTSWLVMPGTVRCNECSRVAEYRIEYFSGASVSTCEKHMPRTDILEPSAFGRVLQSPTEPPTEPVVVGPVTTILSFLARKLLGK
jgi:hypothetical protein